MLSFKEFLIETPTILSDHDKEGNQIDKDEPMESDFKAVKKNGKNYVFRKLHTNKEGIQLWKQNYKGDRNYPIFYAVHKGLIHKTVTGTMGNEDHMGKGGNFIIDTLSGLPNSHYKAHQFYHDIIKHGKLNELHSSEQQSPGGMRTWENLSKMDGISVEHRNYSGETIPLEKDWHKNYGSPSTFVAKLK